MKADSPLKFGILLTSVWGRETAPAVQLAQHREIVQLAQQLGFHSMVAGQHFLGTELRYYQPVPYLMHMGQFAPELRPTTGLILLSLVNPVELAEQVATLDVCCGGRARLCVGLGYADHEFKALGIPRSTRVKRFEEGLELIKALWSGEEVSFQGELFKVEKALPSVMPLQRPRPPIWIGGQGEKAIRRAARMADAWYPPPFPTHKGLANLRNTFLEERSKAGLPLDGEFPLRRELVIAGSRQEARRFAAERSRARYDVYLKWGLGQDLDSNNSGFGSEADDDIDERFVLGTPEQCAEQLDALRRDLGMTEFIFKPQWLGVPHSEAMRQLELFGTKVMPHLRDSARVSQVMSGRP
jgi:alkanesulfonate monooxygenase SsuD/methylene tetrahydromethanopterin reductase-like flavin-dependent oxidoreductase (luciferase family)